MRRQFVTFSALLYLASTYLPLPAGARAQRNATALIARWNVQLYGANPDYLQILIDMRSVKPEVEVLDVRGTATLYAPRNRFLKTARFEIPAGKLAAGRLYVLYERCGAAPVAGVFGISASAKLVVPPAGTARTSSAPLPANLRVLPEAPLQFDKRLKLAGVSASDITLLSPKPPTRMTAPPRRRR